MEIGDALSISSVFEYFVIIRESFIFNIYISYLLQNKVLSSLGTEIISPIDDQAAIVIIDKI